ncbi:SCO7613 C-terminal domain-containing membrane protein [Streptomyces sp. BI20]|uniref:SCO7613 C-terminal domain-containing membrane protein n=1 Tax=Streptomyces sp. BI20 TaxID=3403460 RepID=UPI003C76C0EA
MDHTLSPAEELALVDRELLALDGRRAALLRRRAWLVAVLARQAAPAGPATPSAPVPAARPETSGRGARNVLLTLGAVLLGVAAAAFAVVSWGSLGIGGRALVLGSVTAALFGATVPLAGRGLRATARALTGVALLVSVLDAWALWALEVTAWSDSAFAAVAAAVLTAGWAGHGHWTGLSVSRVGAVPMALLPAPLALYAAGGDAVATGAALLVTAVGYGVLVDRAGPGVVRGFAVACGIAAAALSGLFALTVSGAADAPAGAAPAAALLGLWGVALVVAGLRVVSRGGAGGAAAALATVGALAPVGVLTGLLGPVLPVAWVVPATVLPAAALAAGAAAERVGAPGPVRRGLSWAALIAGGFAVVTALPVAVLAATDPWLADSVTGGLMPGAERLAATVTLFAAAGLGLATRWFTRRRGALASLVVVAAAGAFAAPGALGAPFAVVVGVWLSVSLALGGVATVAALARDSVSAWVVSPAALLATVTTAAAAWHEGPWWALSVWAVLAAAHGGAAIRRGTEGPVRRAHAATAVVLAAGPVWTGARLVGVPVVWAAVALLAPPALAAWRPGPRWAAGDRLSVELTAGVVGLGALLGAALAGGAGTLSLALGLAAAVCAGAALRPDRRRVGSVAGAVFGVLGLWVRLAGWEVSWIEAYTAPPALLLLGLGALRRRREPVSGSWSAYGPGLALALAPSLFALWGEGGWARPLALGLVALGVTLWGARSRLRAPLLLGGAVLALTAGHELAPYVVQLVGVLPRWLPPALAGALLLGVGATYERRLRDARRLRAALGRWS